MFTTTGKCKGGYTPKQVITEVFPIMSEKTFDKVFYNNKIFIADTDSNPVYLSPEYYDNIMLDNVMLSFKYGGVNYEISVGISDTPILSVGTLIRVNRHNGVTWIEDTAIVIQIGLEASSAWVTFADDDSEYLLDNILYVENCYKSTEFDIKAVC